MSFTTNISLTFIRNNRGKFDFTIMQNGKLFYTKTYNAPASKGHDVLFTGFVEYMQKKVNEELKTNPKFHWTSLDEFKRWANPAMQKAYLIELDANA